MAKDSTAAKQAEKRHPAPGVTKDNDPEQNTDYEEDIDSEDARADIEEKMQLFGSGLQIQFDRQVALKEEIERRWLDDLRHYNGVYDQKTEQKLTKKQNNSRIFVNLTRSKCNTAESKWSDLVLPTDDRNWGIKPTPVPTLAMDLTDDTEVQLADGSVAADPETGETYKNKDVAEETIKQAEKSAKMMESEMDDQLVEANYNATCRDIIHNSVVMGTGIIKGPMVEARTKKAWVMDDAGQWTMSQEKELKPTASEVDPWNFFPDMNAVKWEDSEFLFERHLMTKKQLRKLAKQPGFMDGQVRRVLEQEPNARASKLNYLNELREINGISQTIQDNRYEVLEYHGPIDKSDLVACGCNGLDIDNPLEEYEGIVWVSMGIVIRVGLNHLDSEDLPYNVLNWEKDDSCIFGFGVPYRMRDPQKVMNASWRMVLDNAGLSTGPQILINRKLVEPADGNWNLSPRKIWWLTSSDPKVRADYVMQTFPIDSRQEQLTAIFEMAHRLADEETSVPQMQMGATGPDQQQPAMLKTLGGTALWMSANNIMMRRAVKNFDDDITVPFLTRFYDWNMQFNKKAEIKGDYSIDARGTSVLLVREMQARNIQEFINAAMVMPEGPPEIDTRGVLKNMAKGMQIAVGDVMRSDDDYETAQEELKTNPPMDPEVQKMQIDAQDREAERQFKAMQQDKEIQLKLTLAEASRQEAMLTHQTALTQAAAAGQIKMDENEKKFNLEKYKTDWNIKAFYEEMAQKEREGETANYGLEAET